MRQVDATLTSRVRVRAFTQPSRRTSPRARPHDEPPHYELRHDELPPRPPAGTGRSWLVLVLGLVSGLGLALRASRAGAGRVGALTLTRGAPAPARPLGRRPAPG